MHFLIEAKSLLSSPGKMIGEQYRITGVAQAEAIRRQVRIEIYTKVLDRLLSR